MSGAALVTGASKRVGRALAERLAERGFAVAIHYSGSKAEAEALGEALRTGGAKAAVLQADLLEDEATATLVPRAVEALGQPLTLLVNNASIFEHDTVETATDESWHRHIGSNLKAPFFLTQAFARQCPKGARDEAGEPIASGLVVNIIDQRVRKLTPEFMTYTLAKSALWTLTQTAAQGLAPDIRVNGIGPGPTLRGGRQSVEHFAAQRENTVLQRGSNPSEIVQALEFLIDCPAVTGQMIAVDGGQHLGWKTPDVVGVE